jgi:cell division protein FtsL
MISERVAVAPRVIGVPRGGISTWKGRWTALPALAGRERLGEALGQSVLVQLMLVLAFFALAGLLYMAQQSQVSVQEINISVLRSERVELVAKNTSLRTTATSLSSLQRIDAAATSQLHMTKPDLSATVWVSPVVPRVTAPPAVNADTVAAQQSSQPLAWMAHAIRVVQSSL